MIITTWLITPGIVYAGTPAAYACARGVALH